MTMWGARGSGIGPLANGLASAPRLPPVLESWQPGSPDSLLPPTLEQTFDELPPPLPLIGGLPKVAPPPTPPTLPPQINLSPAMQGLPGVFVGGMTAAIGMAAGGARPSEAIVRWALPIIRDASAPNKHWSDALVRHSPVVDAYVGSQALRSLLHDHP